MTHEITFAVSFPGGHYIQDCLAVAAGICNCNENALLLALGPVSHQNVTAEAVLKKKRLLEDLLIGPDAELAVFFAVRRHLNLHLARPSISSGPLTCASPPCSTTSRPMEMTRGKTLRHAMGPAFAETRNLEAQLSEPH